jgi:hypothetical protein
MVKIMNKNRTFLPGKWSREKANPAIVAKRAVIMIRIPAMKKELRIQRGKRFIPPLPLYVVHARM